MGFHLMSLIQSLANKEWWVFMNIRTIRYRQKGFTLIELIIVIALISIVVATIFSFFMFNLRTFNRGENMAQVQFDVRMASEFVTNELRNVNVISLTNSGLSETLDLTELSGKYSNVVNVLFEIKLDERRYFVSYTIDGNSSDGKNPYSITSKVLLNNIKSATLSSGTTLYFTK